MTKWDLFQECTIGFNTQKSINTRVRVMLARGEVPEGLLAPAVIAYIKGGKDSV